MPHHPRRLAALAALWRAVRFGLRPGSPGLGARLASVPRLLRARSRGDYRQLGWARLGVLVAAAAYLVSPVDLLPEAVFLLLGLSDDLAVAAWLAGALLVETERFLEWERSRPQEGRVVPAEVVRHEVRGR